jgi:hypothetical protein
LHPAYRLTTSIALTLQRWVKEGSRGVLTDREMIESKKSGIPDPQSFTSDLFLMLGSRLSTITSSSKLTEGEGRGARQVGLRLGRMCRR